MIVYWIMFLVPALCAMLETPRERSTVSPMWILVALSLMILIGFRWETGGDWINYKMMVEDELLAPSDAGLLSDPAFKIILQVAAHSSAGILLVTVVSGIMMGIALPRFCLAQPRPWLAIAVSVPYLVIVMGMGYVRQGMAISCWMMGVLSIKDRSVLRYCLWVLGGSLFHTTSLILLPLGPLGATRSLPLRIALAFITAALLVYGLESARAESFVTNYVDAQMASSGAAIRLLMTALPSALFLLYRRRFGLGAAERSVWTLMSCAGLLGLPALLAVPSSTVIDRLCLYLLPIQSFVYARLPETLTDNKRTGSLITAAILFLYLATLFVWLNYAVNSWAWQPYRFYFFEDKTCLEC